MHSEDSAVAKQFAQLSAGGGKVSAVKVRELTQELNTGLGRDLSPGVYACVCGFRLQSRIYGCSLDLGFGLFSNAGGNTVLAGIICRQSLFLVSRSDRALQACFFRFRVVASGNGVCGADGYMRYIDFIQIPEKHIWTCQAY